MTHWAETLPAIAKIVPATVQASSTENGNSGPEKAIDADPNQRLIAAEVNGRVVGTMQLSFLPGLSFVGSWRGLIEAVRIAADLRGQKLGEQMILWAVEQCRARDCKLVQLTSSATRTDAHRFYARLGFVQSHVGMKLHLRD